MLARSVLGNGQWLDGGAMFGNVPRALWSRWCPPDDEGRIELACRGALISDGQRHVLLDTGIGAFFSPKLRERFGVSSAEHVLLRSLAALGLGHEDIDAVVLSHLHFDHAGGLLAPYVDGAAPALLFPKAKYIVGEEAFERARAPHSRDRASFIAELPRLLEESGRLELIDHRAESPTLGPRFAFWRSFGHTPGMLCTRVRGDRAELFFCADLVPGVAWVHLPVTMGYDRYPELLIDEKSAIFQELHAAGAWLWFTHDPRVAAARLAREGERWTAGHTVLDAESVAL